MSVWDLLNEAGASTKDAAQKRIVERLCARPLLFDPPLFDAEPYKTTVDRVRTQLATWFPQWSPIDVSVLNEDEGAVTVSISLPYFEHRFVVTIS